MNRRRLHHGRALSAAVLLLLSMSRIVATAQEVDLATIDAKSVAKGYRGDALRLRSVVNDRGEAIGRIDDFIFGRDNGQVFAVLSVGDFTGLSGNLVAVPFRSLKLDDP